MNSPRITRIVPDDCRGLRLDQTLARLIPELSRRTARLALSIGCVFVDKKRVKVASRRVTPGQVLQAHLGAPFQRALRGATSDELPQLDVLFEDPQLLVIDKPAGVFSAPTPESDRNNLKSLLEHERESLYVIHRLDAQTSGVLVFAKSRAAARTLSKMFREHDLQRTYSSFVAGEYPLPRETLQYPVAGRSATSHVELVECFGRSASDTDGYAFSWLRVTLDSGRTHQIRVHLSQRGYPVLGDRRYGQRLDSDRSRWPPRLALHAERLAFAHPIEQRPLEFTAPLPEDLRSWLDRVRGP